MNLQPFHRRYGYGAAKLPIGLPPGNRSLAVDARTSVSRERYFAAIPGLLCVLLAMLLSATTRLTHDEAASPLALIEPTRIEFAFEDNALPEIADASPTPPVPASAPEEAKSPEPLPVQIAETAPKPAPPKATPFDPRDLVIASRPTPAAPAKASRAFDLPRSPGHRPGLAAPRAKLAALPSNVLSTGSAESVETLTAFSSDSAPSAPARSLERPTARDSGAGVAPEAFVRPVGSAQKTRQNFLASLTAETTTAPHPASARPAVATAAPQVIMSKKVRGAVSGHARSDGWHEVPLDELPDCSPPGRQDQLKKKILLATAKRGERSCSHRGGSFRFVETRNLNAFLMWSRTNSDGGFEARPVRDVCDVLTRALRCLEEASMEEYVGR